MLSRIEFRQGTGLHYNTFRYYDSDIGRFTQLIKARDNGRVYVEPAKNKPLSPVEAENKYQIGRSRGRDYVETDVPNSMLEWKKNPRYHTDELIVRGDVILNNAKITRRK
ncbi:HYD1 signature containing ADP-ribosyltransferase family protein [Snodgrassella communis]|uniref:HYD1 signature containing ADP-ribosyltransferase family protein n=1 Tax=Snodgrassella communis TaxID=2946699 RepID=UPI003B969708